MRLALALMLAAAALDARAQDVINPGGGTGGVTSLTCSAPFACAPASGAVVFSWTGATLTGTPAGGDLSCWTGANTEQLITNASGVAGNVLTWANGVCPTWSAPAGGGSALSALTAAVAANTIANGNNLQTWQAAKTSDSSGFLRITESAASTGGTSTAGVPNQYLLKVDTVAASTASPATFYSRANHVASISPTTSQIFATAGTSVNPTYGFTGDPGTGMFSSAAGDTLKLGVSGFVNLQLSGAQASITSGTATSPSLTNISFADTGTSWLASNTVSIVNSTDGEWVRFGSRFMQPIRGSADATAFAINAQKARGTASAPTVITTGDALLTTSGYGYVGATNTYREATRIEFDSTGTIADTTSGIGGTLKLMTAKAGTDTAPQTNVTITGGSTGNVTIASGTTLNPAQVAGIVGTTTNNAAQAGSVGELITATAAANAVALTTNTTANVTSVSLTAGDWDCTGTVNFTFGATTSITNLSGGASQTSATLPAQDLRFDNETAAQVPTATSVAAYPIPTAQELLAGTTTVFLVAQATFTVSTLGAGGTLRCRRIR